MSMSHIDECGGAELRSTPLCAGRMRCVSGAHFCFHLLWSRCRADSDIGSLSPVGTAAEQGGVNHQSKINADDDPMGNLMWGE